MFPQLNGAGFDSGFTACQMSSFNTFLSEPGIRFGHLSVENCLVEHFPCQMSELWGLVRHSHGSTQWGPIIDCLPESDKHTHSAVFSGVVLDLKYDELQR